VLAWRIKNDGSSEPDRTEIIYLIPQNIFEEAT